MAAEPGEDRKAGGVARGPARGANVVRVEAPDRAGAGSPAVPAARRVERVQLVELAVVAVHYQRVTVAARRPAALDRNVLGNRVRPLVGLAGVVELDGDLLLVPGD